VENFEENKLDSMFVNLVTEECSSGTSALLSNQNHKNEFKFILFKSFHLVRTQLLIVRGILVSSEKDILLNIIYKPQLAVLVLCAFRKPALIFSLAVQHWRTSE